MVMNVRRFKCEGPKCGKSFYMEFVGDAKMLCPRCRNTAREHSGSFDYRVSVVRAGKGKDTK